MSSIRTLGLLLACLTGGTVIAADEPKDDPAKKEVEKLQGVWVWRATEVKGGEDDSEVFAKLAGRPTWTVKGDKWTLEFAGQDGKRHSYPGTIKIDPTTTPKRIDFTYDKGNPIYAGEKMLGVYELNGDTLRLAWGAFGAVVKDERERPKELTWKEGNKFLIFVFKRPK